MGFTGAIRTVDLDPRLNAAIAQFVTENKIQPGAFLFQSRSGRAMHLVTAFTRLQKQNVHGFHAFRQFRITWLRDLGTPEDILRYWVGHQGFGITDRYSKLAENVELRKQWSVRAGLGFDISLVGQPAPRIPEKPRKLGPDPLGRVIHQVLLAFGNDHGKLRTIPRRKKIKTAMWVGEKQWQALKALANRFEPADSQRGIEY